MEQPIMLKTRLDNFQGVFWVKLFISIISATKQALFVYKP